MTEGGCEVMCSFLKRNFVLIFVLKKVRSANDLLQPFQYTDIP